MGLALFLAISALVGGIIVAAIVAISRRRRGLLNEPTSIVKIVAAVWALGLVMAAIVIAVPGSASAVPPSVLAAGTAVLALLRRRELIRDGRDRAARQYLMFGFMGFALAVFVLAVGIH